MIKINYPWLLIYMFLTISSLHAADVTITVNGKVVAKPCTVSTSNVNVDLGNIYTANMVTAGSGSIWQRVDLNLTNCPIGTSRIMASFSGLQDSTGFYENQGSAGNIQIELQDTQGNTLNSGSSKIVQVDDTSQSASFPLQVRALSVNGHASQGSIQAIISITYTYS